ncbi:ornithine carbamoyltransferase [Desulfovibrio aminophilus]|nr:ornithine carbamoyltransferase [Desulfovibrio aminophilus]MCM0754541.1 ornithine carbamoyltransferase [Desulfovibrio aminophilus]
MPKNFIHVYDFSQEEILDVLELIRLLKVADKGGRTPRLLDGASLGMIFEEPSTRTRVSFEVAATKLGGHALYLKPGEIHLGERESLADTARVLSRMCDVIVARCWKHETILGLAKHSTVPVINGLTDYNHPTQALCDLFTMREHLPAGKTIHDLKVTFIGDATNVCSSTLFATTLMGMDFTQAAPKAYQAPKAWVEIGRANVARYGGSVTITENVEEAVQEADIIYTDLWWWCGQEAEIPDRRKAFMPRYQVNGQLFSRAPAHCKLMHCLPASRGVEATDEILDSPRSIIFDQAENRLHAEKGILAWLVAPTLKRADGALGQYYADQTRAFLRSRGWDN